MAADKPGNAPTAIPTATLASAANRFINLNAFAKPYIIFSILSPHDYIRNPVGRGTLNNILNKI